MDLRAALWNVLGFGLLPLWLAAGGADWLCHRRTHIATTAGPRESAFHLALFLQIAIPTLLALWLEITAAMLVLFAAGVLAHMVTSWADTAFAQPRRHIAPVEQLVHSWLEMLPAFALVIVTLLHGEALVDPEWRFVVRTEPVARVWVWATSLGFAAGLACILEEGWRGLRTARAVRPAPRD